MGGQVGTSVRLPARWAAQALVRGYAQQGAARSQIAIL